MNWMEIKATPYMRLIQSRDRAATTTEQGRRQLVAAAAKVMDQLKPGWERNIDLPHLNINLETNCIAGQNGLSYRVPAKEMQALGLSPSPFHSNEYVNDWIEEINLRLAA